MFREISTLFRVKEVHVFRLIAMILVNSVYHLVSSFLYAASTFLSRSRPKRASPPGSNWALTHLPSTLLTASVLATQLYDPLW